MLAAIAGSLRRPHLPKSAPAGVPQKRIAMPPVTTALIVANVAM